MARDGLNAVIPGCGVAFVDAREFKPQTPAASRKLAFLLQRGAVVIGSRATSVRIAHAGRTAKIDAVGRVQWDV